MADKFEPDKFRSFLKENLSKKRFVHSLNVADMSKELAELYGADEEKAYFAGLVHDIAKELPRSAQSSPTSDSKSCSLRALFMASLLVVAKQVGEHAIDVGIDDDRPIHDLLCRCGLPKVYARVGGLGILVG